MTITGTGFLPGAAAALTRDGQLVPSGNSEVGASLAPPAEIEGTDVAVVSDTEITCTFDLDGAELGDWHVRVTNANAMAAQLDDGFTVLPVHEVIITEGPDGAPNPVASEGEVACSVEAENSHGHDLTYLWTVEAGVFDDATAQSPTWTAPANNTNEVAEYEITVTVTCAEEEEVSAEASYTQRVEPAHAVRITAGPDGAPNPVASEGEVACSVEAENSYGHDLTYLWTAEGGAFDDASAQNPTWTAPANNTDEVAEYEITVTVTCAEDEEVSAEASYTQRVEPVHEVRITEGPVSYPNPVASEGDVDCSVEAENSLGHDLTYLWTAEAGAFDDASAQNPTWTAPANSTSEVAEYEITVTVTCAEDEEVSASGSYTQRVEPGRSHHFAAGLQMVSLPLLPTDPDPAQMGFFDGRWARWNPVAGGYVFYQADPERYTWFDPVAAVPGKGYWMQFAEAARINVAGVPAADGAVAIPLPAGWSQIGNPRPEALPWRMLGDGALRVRHNGAEMTLAEAQAAGLCEDFAWAYRDGAGYELVYDRSVIAVGLHDHLNAWEGYWFRAYQPVELVFPALAEVAAAAVRPAAERAEGDWSIPLIATVESGAGARVVVGQSAAPRQMQLPPSFGPGAQLSVLGADRRLGVDLQQQGEAPVWTLQAVSGAAGSQVTLQWPDLSEVPHDYRPMLVDTATGKRTYMRTSQGYSFTTGEAGEARYFEVQMAPAEVGALVTSATASATGGGNVEVRVTVSAAATVDAEVVNIAGRRVGTVAREREMEAGSETLLWDAMSDRGTRLPGGMYLIRITARTEDGQQTSALAPLQLGR